MYSKKYKVREITNVEPFISMTDQNIISPYPIQFINKCTSTLSFSFRFLTDMYQIVTDTYKKSISKFAWKSIKSTLPLRKWWMLRWSLSSES